MSLSQEHLRWVEDMDEKVKNISNPVEIQAVRADIAKLRKDVKKMKGHLDKVAASIMEALKA